MSVYSITDSLGRKNGATGTPLSPQQMNELLLNAQKNIRGPIEAMRIQAQHKHESEVQQKAALDAFEKKQKEEEAALKKKLEASKANALLGIMKRYQWDEMGEDNQREAIAQWKIKNPSWIDVPAVFTRLAANRTGSFDSYVNNVIASTSQITVAPHPDQANEEVTLFYGTIYPRAAAIVWWAGVYGVTITNCPHWYTIVYVRSITQNAALLGDEISDDISKNKGAISAFFLAAVAIVVIGMKLL